METYKNRYTFEVPGKPVPLERPYVVRHHAFDRPRSKQAKSEIAAYALSARVRNGKAVFQGMVGMDVSFHGMRANADLSNCLKQVEDACNGVVYNDDKQLCVIHVYRVACEKGKEGTQVIVWEIS